jgi:hypothetical protein
MRMTWRIRLGIALTTVAATAGASGQAANGLPATSMVMISYAGPNAAAIRDGGEVVREIDDPHTGARWLLARDSIHPGGPGRMILVFEPRGHEFNSVVNGVGNKAPVEARSQTRIGTQSEPGPLQPESAPPQPVIRAGDRLIVEENTAVVDSRLEAVALNQAAIGSPLNVRLGIGGRVVRAVAVAPGRATFLAETDEARP